MANKLPRGLLYQLQGVPWDWFCTFTFGIRRLPDPDNAGKFTIATSRPPSRHIRYSMFYKWLRMHQKLSGQKQTVFVLRHELGELGHRPHFHALMQVPGEMQSISHRFRAMAAWGNIGGGFARIRPIQSRSANLPGYVLKAPLGGSAGADKYESTKFEASEWEDINLSSRLVEILLDPSCSRSGA